MLLKGADAVSPWFSSLLSASPLIRDICTHTMLLCIQQGKCLASAVVIIEPISLLKRTLSYSCPGFRLTTALSYIMLFEIVTLLWHFAFCLMDVIYQFSCCLCHSIIFKTMCKMFMLQKSWAHLRFIRSQLCYPFSVSVLELVLCCSV